MNIGRLEQARRALDRARLALAAGLPHQAAGPTQKSVAMHPDFVEGRLAEARVLLSQQQPAQALARLDALEQSNPHCRSWPQVTLLRIEALAQNGQLALALKSARDLVKQYPDDVRPQRLLGALSVQAGDTQEAAAALQRVLALEPSDSVTRRVLAELLESQPQDAAEILEPELGVDPEDDRISRLQLARLLLRSSRLGEADEQLSTLLLEEKEDANLWLDAGSLADDLGADRLAAKRLQQAVTRARRRPATAVAAWAALARVHMHAGRFAQAGWCWWRLSRLDSQSAQALLGLAICALLSGRDALARHAQQEAAKIASPEESGDILARHWLDAASGREIQRANLLIGGMPSSVDSSPLAGLLVAAVQTLAAHAHSHPTRADAFYQQALCHQAAGRADKAAAAVAQALRINPHYADALRLSGSLPSAKQQPAA